MLFTFKGTNPLLTPTFGFQLHKNRMKGLSIYLKVCFEKLSLNMKNIILYLFWITSICFVLILVLHLFDLQALGFVSGIVLHCFDLQVSVLFRVLIYTCFDLQVSALLQIVSRTLLGNTFQFYFAMADATFVQFCFALFDKCFPPFSISFVQLSMCFVHTWIS